MNKHKTFWKHHKDNLDKRATETDLYFLYRRKELKSRNISDIQIMQTGDSFGVDREEFLREKH